MAGTAPPLLFSLQLFVDRVSWAKAEATRSDASPPPLVGFQLLQYEIVLFDRRERTGDGAQLVLEHGKSCLFEAEPAALADRLRDDRGAPLVLLLMTQERERVRLSAFASIPLPVHVGLRLDDGLPADMTYRVCEWARGSGEWELCDHRGGRVGSATGAVTLSCLGKSLAPHLVSALGVRVDGASPSNAPPSPASVKSREDEERKKHDGGTWSGGEGSRPSLAAAESDPEQAPPVRDAAVQYEEIGVEENQYGRESSR